MSTAGAQSKLRALVLKNSFYEVVGYGTSQALRLLSNLVLTRLLFPEAFGLMALVGIVLYGLSMLSDVGILQSVVQNERGEDEDFLNTAWTMQIVRGAGLCVVTAVVAYPVALAYGERQLFPLLLAAGGQLLIGGFVSTSLLSLRRQIQSAKLMIIEVGVQLMTLVGVVVTAYLWRSVWALLIGSVLGTVLRVIWSHRIDVGYRNRLKWDKSAWKEITGFGRWIFGSSIATFISSQSDRLLLGHLLGVATLGVYSIAVFVSDAIRTLVTRVVGDVFYPVFSRERHKGNDYLRDEYYFLRLRLDLAVLPAMGMLSMLGDFLIQFMWDERYADAGWMLRILCLRIATACAMQPCEVCLVATGASRFGFGRSVARMIGVMIGIPLGYHFGGMEGLVWGVALSELPAALVLWPAAARRGLFRLSRELLSVLLYGLGLLAGATARYLAVGAWF